MNETTVQPTKRIDPPFRQVEGRMITDLSNKDPKRHYVLANPNDPYCGVDEMAARGYLVETIRKGGPYYPGIQASKEGSAVTRLGQVLMSCPIELYQSEWNRSQQVASERQRSITQAGGVDGVRSPATGRPATWAQDPTETIVRG